MIDIDNNLCGFTLIEFLLFFRQALEAISEVGDLLQLKYSRREQPLPSLGWMAEESLLQDWATSSSPPLHPDPRLLTLSFYCPSFPSEPVSLPHHGLTTTRVLHLFRKACTPASLISGVQSVTSTFHAYSSGRTKITPSTFLGMSVVTKQFRAFQFVLTYCDCIGLTLSLTPVCTSNVCLICAIIIITTTWSSFVVQTTVKQSRPIFFSPRVPTPALGEKKKSDRSRCYDEQKSKQL